MKLKAPWGATTLCSMLWVCGSLTSGEQKQDEQLKSMRTRLECNSHVEFAPTREMRIIEIRSSTTLIAS